MSNRKLKVDTREMLGFRLLTEAPKLASNQQTGSKVGAKPAKKIDSMIGAKTGEKAKKLVSFKIGSKIGGKVGMKT